MENVPQVHSEQNIKDFGEWITFLDSLGYVSKWQDLNAKDYGVAQNRERCFMVSYLDKSLKFAFPAGLNLKKYAPDYVEYVVNDKYYMNFGTLNTILNNEIIEDINKGDVKKVKKLQRFSRSLGLYSASLGLVDFTTKESRLKAVANCITAHPATIKTHQSEGNAVLYDTGTNYFIRKLTPLECLRLMDVDDEDAFKMLAVNSETQVYKQAGNSIVVAVMVAIFKNLFLGGSEKEKTQIDIFDILE